MKSTNRIITLALLAMVTLFWVPTGAVGQISPGGPSPVNAAATVALPPTGVITSSGLTLTVAPGVVFCNGNLTPMHLTQLTVPASTTSFVYMRCPSEQVFATTTPPLQNIDVSLATIVAGASTITTNTDTRGVSFFPNMSDFVVPFGPGDCAWSATGTLGATTGLNLQAIGASFTSVNSISTTAAGASTDTLTCNIHIPYRTTTGKGAQPLDCVIYYGVQTTALTSVGAPTLSSITMPAPGTAETASTVTPVSLGAVTVTPVIGSANLGTTTAGAFFSEKVSVTTPVFLNTDQQVIQFQQTFVQSAAAAQIVNTPGGVCHVFQAPI